MGKFQFIVCLYFSCLKKTTSLSPLFLHHFFKGGGGDNYVYV